LFYVLNFTFPVDEDMAQFDDVDFYGTFNPKEAERLGVSPLEEDAPIVPVDVLGESNSIGATGHVNVNPK
jgi:hypothetical protein